MGSAGSWDMLYDPRKLWNNGQGGGLKNLTKGSNWSREFGDMGLNGQQPSDKAKQDRLNNVGADGQLFGEQAADNYAAMTGRLNGSLDDLQAQAQGKNSVSALQLSQANQQNLAQQRSMAAGAGPNNQAMAARTGAMQMGRLGSGLAGQQAVAGLQERNQAQQNYGNLLGAARGQDAQAAIGGYNAATGAYGGGLNGEKDPTQIGQWGGAIGSLFGLGAK